MLETLEIISHHVSLKVLIVIREAREGERRNKEGGEQRRRLLATGAATVTRCHRVMARCPGSYNPV